MLYILTLADLLHPSLAQLPGEYIPAYMLQGTMGNLSTIAISVYSQVLIYNWVNRGTIVVTCSPSGMGLKPMILWLRVRCANHPAITTRQSILCKLSSCSRRLAIGHWRHLLKHTRYLPSPDRWRIFCLLDCLFCLQVSDALIIIGKVTAGLPIHYWPADYTSIKNL